MNLRDLNIKIHYDTMEDNLVDDFYNPVLSKAVNYFRIAGYFSSTSLAIAARGITSLIRNGGKMFILCSPQFTPEDYNMLEEIFLNKVERQFTYDLANIEDDLIKDYIGCFG